SKSSRQESQQDRRQGSGQEGNRRQARREKDGSGPPRHQAGVEQVATDRSPGRTDRRGSQVGQGRAGRPGRRRAGFGRQEGRRRILAAGPVQGQRAEGSRQGQALRQRPVHRRRALVPGQARFGQGQGSPAQETERRRAISASPA